MWHLSSRLPRASCPRVVNSNEPTGAVWGLPESDLDGNLCIITSAVTTVDTVIVTVVANVVVAVVVIVVQGTDPCHGRCVAHIHPRGKSRILLLILPC